jgi:endo-1,4-beta-mannosidase
LDNFIFIKNGKFFLNNKEFKFIGTNVYEIANLDTSVTNKIIDDAYNFGFKVLRFWLFQNKPVSEIIAKLNEICHYVNPLKLKLIICLADKWGYLQNYKISCKWYEYGYKKHYLNYVKTITNEFKHRNEIMLWELINEPITNSFEVFYNFADNVSYEIKSVNQNHLISLGTVGGVGDKFGSYYSVFNKNNFRKLFLLNTLDAVSLHDYSYDSGIFERLDILNRFKGSYKTAKIFSAINKIINMPFNAIDNYFLKKNRLIKIPFTLRWLWNLFNIKDIKFAHSINKPIYIGELGVKNYHGKKRSKIFNLIIKEKFKLGVSGILLWSFQAQGWNNDGHNYGFSFGEGIENVIMKWYKAQFDKESIFMN